MKTEFVDIHSLVNASLFIVATLFMDSLFVAAKATSNLGCLHESSFQSRNQAAVRAESAWLVRRK